MTLERQKWIVEWILRANTFRSKKDFVLEKQAEDLLKDLTKELKGRILPDDNNSIK